MRTQFFALASTEASASALNELTLADGWTREPIRRHSEWDFGDDEDEVLVTTGVRVTNGLRSFSVEGQIVTVRAQSSMPDVSAWLGRVGGAVRLMRYLHDRSRDHVKHIYWRCDVAGACALTYDATASERLDDDVMHEFGMKHYPEYPRADLDGVDVLVRSFFLEEDRSGYVVTLTYREREGGLLLGDCAAEETALR